METRENKDWEKLNEYQKMAVLDESPACVVNANVGSGKTTVLIAKVLYLYLEKKVPLEDMLVLTFTNKAAQEILSRLLLREPELSPEQRAGFGTFHSVALRLLKEKLPVEKAGWDRDFSVMEPEEETELAQRIIKEEKLNIKYKNRLKKRLEQEYKAYLEGREVSRYGDDLFRLYPLLKQEKQRENKMSFSDLLLVSTELIKEEGFHPAWVIADEIQDSDNLQLEFLEALVGEETRLFAVGDPNQVIYSWRGSSDSTFFALKRKFSAKELSLPVNYRSNARILEAANHFRQFGTRIQGCREEGKLIKVKRQYDPFTEAEYLAEQIESLHKAGESYEDTAILYRLQRQGELLEKVFEKRGIPYQVSVKQTVKDIPALDWMVKILRFSVNPRDRQTGEDVLLNPGFGEKLTKKKVRDLLEEGKGKSFLYEQMKGFQDWSSSQTKIPKWREIFDYFGLGEAFGPTSAGYKEKEEQAGKLLEWLRVYCEKKELSLWEGTRAFLNDGAKGCPADDPPRLKGTGVSPGISDRCESGADSSSLQNYGAGGRGAAAVFCRHDKGKRGAGTFLLCQPKRAGSFRRRKPISSGNPSGTSGLGGRRQEGKRGRKSPETGKRSPGRTAEEERSRKYGPCPKGSSQKVWGGNTALSK